MWNKEFKNRSKKILVCDYHTLLFRSGNGDYFYILGHYYENEKKVLVN